MLRRPALKGSGFRELSANEITAVAGGGEEGDVIVVTGSRYKQHSLSETSGGGGGGGIIVVTGERYDPWTTSISGEDLWMYPELFGNGPGNDHDDYFGDGGGGDVTDAVETDDADVKEVVIKIDRPLTAEEQAAAEQFQEQVAQTDAWVKSLADEDVLKLDDGSLITGAEVKEAWAKVDFVINPENVTGSPTYSNGTDFGEADWNNGDPVVSFNIDYLTERANAGSTELAWLVGHELGHLVADQRAQLVVLGEGGITMKEHQQMANDFAYALAQYNGTTLPTPKTGYDYSAPHPLFEPPTPPAPTPPVSPDLPGHPDGPYLRPGYHIP